MTLLFGYNACRGPSEDLSSKETILGSPTVSFDIKAFAAPVGFNGLQSCVQGIALYDALGRGVSFLIQNNFGIPPEGIHLADLDVATGDYAEIVLTFSTDCDSSSIEFSNSSGRFLTTDVVAMTFEGSSQILSGGKISLEIQPVVNALNTVTDPTQIGPQVDANPGAYTYNP